MFGSAYVPYFVCVVVWYCPNLSLEACVVAVGSSEGVVTSVVMLYVNTAPLVLCMHYALCFCEDSSLAFLSDGHQQSLHD